MLRIHRGEATRLPLPDNIYDVDTCQTVLMHLERPLEALREMLRILRPGGLLICSEPNNLWNFLSFTSLTATEPIETQVRRFEFWLRYHRGKVQLGQGDHTIGDLLTGLFAEVGMEQIEVYQSDRAGALVPPYQTAEQQSLLAQEKEWRDSATGCWDYEELRKCVFAGGGSKEFFAQGFQDLVAKFDAEQKSIASGSFHSSGGSLCYLVSGRKISTSTPLRITAA